MKDFARLTLNLAAHSKVLVCLHHKLTCMWKRRYLDGGILEAKAACRVFNLREEGTARGGVQGGRLRTLGELKGSCWGLGGGAGTGVLGGTAGPAGPAGLGEGPKRKNPLWPGLDGEGAPQGEVTEYGR